MHLVSHLIFNNLVRFISLSNNEFDIMKLLLLVPNKSNSYEIKIEVKGEDKKNDKKIRKMIGVD